MASKAIDKNKTKNKTLRNRMMYFKQEKNLGENLIFIVERGKMENIFVYQNKYLTKKILNKKL